MNINYDKPTIGKQKTSFFDKISNFGKGIKTKIDDYETDAPERRKRKIAALKQEVQLAKLQKEKKKLMPMQEQSKGQAMNDRINKII